MPQTTKPSPFRDALQRKAFVLRNAAPAEWEDFLSGLADYSQDVTLAVVEADPKDILNRQGRAQMMLSLHRLFAECHLPRPQPAAQPTQPVP